MLELGLLPGEGRGPQVLAVLAPSLARSWAAPTEQGYRLSPCAFPVIS